MGDDVPGRIPHVKHRTGGDHPQPVDEPFAPQSDELAVDLRHIRRVQVLVVGHAELEDPVPELDRPVHDLPLHVMGWPVGVGGGEDLRARDAEPAEELDPEVLRHQGELVDVRTGTGEPA